MFPQEEVIMSYKITRRQILKFLSVSIGANIVPQILIGNAFAANSNTNVQIIDVADGLFSDPPKEYKCDNKRESFYRSIYEKGVKTVIRYYSGEKPGEPINNAGLRCKNITTRERDIIHDSGLSLAIVYQLMGQKDGRYNSETGKRDASFCIERTKYLNQPEGSTIFFGVDGDEHNETDLVNYFKQVKIAFDGRYEIGCYGSGRSCEAATEIAKFSWIAESPNWTKTRSYMNNKKWHIYQNKTQVQYSEWTKKYGVNIDTNILNPTFNTIGAFKKDGSLVTYNKSETDLIASKRMWVKAQRLPILNRPLDGQEVKYICVARMVHVIGDIRDGWALVDIDEDGKPEGYCDARQLLPLSEMPEYKSGCVGIDY